MKRREKDGSVEEPGRSSHVHKRRMDGRSRRLLPKDSQPGQRRAGGELRRWRQELGEAGPRGRTEGFSRMVGPPGPQPGGLTSTSRLAPRRARRAAGPDHHPGERKGPEGVSRGAQRWDRSFPVVRRGGLPGLRQDRSADGFEEEASRHQAAHRCGRLHHPVELPASSLGPESRGGSRSRMHRGSPFGFPDEPDSSRRNPAHRQPVFAPWHPQCGDRAGGRSGGRAARKRPVPKDIFHRVDGGREGVDEAGCRQDQAPVP